MFYTLFHRCFHTPCFILGVFTCTPVSLGFHTHFTRCFDTLCFHFSFTITGFRCSRSPTGHPHNRIIYIYKCILIKKKKKKNKSILRWADILFNSICLCSSVLSVVRRDLRCFYTFPFTRCFHTHFHRCFHTHFHRCFHRNSHPFSQVFSHPFSQVFSHLFSQVFSHPLSLGVFNTRCH